MWGLIRSTTMCTAQVSPKGCSRNISRVRGSRTSQGLKNSFAGFECLLCTRESMNLKRPGLSCSCHGFHSFRAASLELWILKAPSDLGRPLFLYQPQNTSIRHDCWDASPESCTENGGEFSPPHFLNLMKEG